ncbi:MAG: 5'/3'-nucleotidase SurE [Clostridia bacterium]|nr:5'/3'-nucleotidase SurE [Clostridia bacterium]
MSRILLTNDDGIFAEGIYEIAKLLAKEHELYVVAPESQRSGASHSITLRKELILKEVKLPELENVHAYSLSGTPADCVRFAIGTLHVQPNLVVSGINLGANLGTDVFYSGTLGAATEGALMGFRSIALSVVSHNARYVKDAARLCMDAVNFYLENSDCCNLMSVNVPNLPYDEIKGAVIAHLSHREYPSEYVKQPDGSYVMPPWSLVENNDKKSDESMIVNGYVTYTPVLTQRCESEALDPMRTRLAAWQKKGE